MISVLYGDIKIPYLEAALAGTVVAAR